MNPPAREDDTLPLPQHGQASDRAFLPRYRVLQEIARGGMGIVLRVYDPELDRVLALKVLREEHRDNPEMLARFLEEARIAGRLQHPGVVPIHDSGHFADNRPFFTMKLVEGRTLAELLGARSSPADDLPHFLRIFEQVCQTMAYAHSKGVIHRDLKPGNVMVGNFGEVQVMDWGVAKVLGGQRPTASGGPLQPPELPANLMETMIRPPQPPSKPIDRPAVQPVPGWAASSTELTQAGSVVGTPAYMPPEQARGEPLDERADVFGLGAILCEVLTGQPPYRWPRDVALWLIGEDRDLQDAHDRLQKCCADPELISLACVCLSAEPGNRPRDATAVTQRLRAYRAGAQERLHRSELERTAAVARADAARLRIRAERRARRLLLGLSLMGLLLVALAGTAVWWWQQRREATRQQVQLHLSQARNLAEQAAAADHPEQALVRYQEAAALLEQAQQLVTVGPGGQDLEDQLRAQQELLAGEITLRKRDRDLLEGLGEIRAQKEDDYGQADTDARYRSLFQKHDLDVERQPIDELTRRIKFGPSSVVRELVAALDDWCGERRRLGQPPPRWLPLLRLAAAIDDSPWRNDLRRLVEPGTTAGPRKGQRWRALLELAGRADREQLPPASVQLLAAQLRRENQHAEAIRLLRSAQLRHPQDVWLNHDLAHALHYQPRPQLDEAIRFYTAARASRPEIGHALAHALQQRGRFDDAANLFRELTRLRPKNHHHFICLGLCLNQMGRYADGETAFRAVVRLAPGSYHGWFNLGVLLNKQNKLAEAADCYRKASELDRSEGHPWLGLGQIHERQGKRRLAESAYRRAMALSPNEPQTYFRLAFLLAQQGKTDEAIRFYRELLARDPRNAEGRVNLAWLLWQRRSELAQAQELLEAAVRIKPDLLEARWDLGQLLFVRGQCAASLPHLRYVVDRDPNNAPMQGILAQALTKLGRYAESIPHFERSLALEPNQALRAFQLGLNCYRLGRYEEAICWNRRTLQLDPDNAETWCNLGHSLRQAGLFSEAFDALKQGHTLGTRRTDWRYESALWLRDAERLTAIEPRLDGLLGGAESVTSERLVAVRALYLLGRHDDSVRLVEAALKADPKLAEGTQAFDRPAAVASALLAALSTDDTTPLPQARRAELRRLALGWLDQEVDQARRLLVSERRGDRQRAQSLLNKLLGQKSLVGLMEHTSLARLPRDEQDRFVAQWNEAGRLLRYLSAP